ncbi:hypothetical protein RchiOBHm_Chr3g0480571 [Rosa chinensis]|uniref:Uncharacterized protein n=1 Tax=Rosa chinensis TaxID=74649 RepID=A0A2P6RDR2_ROSCH|nr:hypothetical protein RchiOBHm_Chr3g0480571 [Rosa chinensis]
MSLQLENMGSGQGNKSAFKSEPKRACRGRANCEGEDRLRERSNQPNSTGMIFLDPFCVGWIKIVVDELGWAGFRSVHHVVHLVVLEHNGSDILPKKIVFFGELEWDEVTDMIGCGGGGEKLGSNF